MTQTNISSVLREEILYGMNNEVSELIGKRLGRAMHTYIFARLLRI